MDYSGSSLFQLPIKDLTALITSLKGLIGQSSPIMNTLTQTYHRCSHHTPPRTLVKFMVNVIMLYMSVHQCPKGRNISTRGLAAGDLVQHFGKQ